MRWNSGGSGVVGGGKERPKALGRVVGSGKGVEYTPVEEVDPEIEQLAEESDGGN